MREAQVRLAIVAGRESTRTSKQAFEGICGGNRETDLKPFPSRGREEDRLPEWVSDIITHAILHPGDGLHGSIARFV